jgi:hypothetical protein
MAISKMLQCLLFMLFTVTTCSFQISSLTARTENIRTKRKEAPLEKEEEKKGNDKVDPALEKFEKNNAAGIDLTDISLEEEDMTYLVEWLTKHNNTISSVALNDPVTLNVSNCKLSIGSLNELFKFMAGNPGVITVLDIENNGSVSVIDTMSDFIKNHPEAAKFIFVSLKHLDLKNSGIVDNEARELAEIIKQAGTGSSLSIGLDLADNKMTTLKSVIQIQDMVSEINLDGNQIPLQEKVDYLNGKLSTTTDKIKLGEVPSSDTSSSQTPQSAVIEEIPAAVVTPPVTPPAVAAIPPVTPPAAAVIPPVTPLLQQQ